MTHRLEANLPVPNGVVFLYDPSAIIDVPPDTGAGPVLATDNCVSLWTVHEVDGSATLVLTDTYEDLDCKVVFRGRLKTAGRKLAFNTSSCDSIIELDLATEVAEVSVYSNDASDPSKIVCVIISAVMR